MTSVCPGCSESFEQLPSERDRGRRYCSRDCYARSLHGNEGRSDGLWRCSRCGEVKPVDEFHKRNTGRPLSQCKACANAYRTEWTTQNRHRNRGYQLQSKYGLTVEEVDALLERQAGRCAGCREELPGGRGTHLDHCHETGRVRGILCQRCNMAVGLLADSPETLRRLADYLTT